MHELEIWPGPMEGVMAPPLVAAIIRLGLLSRWLTPFFRVSGEVPRKNRLREFLAPFAGGEVPVCVQLMGNRPDVLAAAAENFAELGAAAIDLNCGCPSRRVTGSGAGGALLKDVPRLCRIVTAVKAAVAPLPLSVKLRTGWSDPREMEQILPALAATGCLDRCFCHYRTVAEGYAPAPDRERRLVRAAELLSGVPLVINGDLTTVAESRELAALTGAAGVMIARGWLRDPYLLRRFAVSDCPDAETGRRRLFAVARQCGLAGGGLLELARMLWGTGSPEFRALLAQP